MKRNEKNLLRRFGNIQREPYYHQLDLRQIDDLDDAAFAYLVANVKGVNMLDLNETEISNESICLISTMEYINELRAKGCQKLDDGCIPYLNSIASLRLLHLKGTGVTINGLLQLTHLNNLTTLLFSADDVTAIKEQLLQLKTMLPHCELVIDAKRYYFNAIDLFVFAIKQKPYSYRLKIKNEPMHIAWSDCLLRPGDNSLQVSAQGSYLVEDIEWVDIHPIEKRIGEQGIPEVAVDHSEQIIQLLNYLAFPYMENEGIISAYLVDREI